MTKVQHDLFISHASEDKELFVRPLAAAFRELGVKIWYDEHTLKIGDSLSASIDKGLKQSRFGLVVISPDFLKKAWPEYEFRSLVSLEHGRAQRILPVWWNVDRSDVLDFSPHLADKVAALATHQDPLHIALRILQVVKPEAYGELARQAALEPKATPLRSIALNPIVGPPLAQSQLRRVRLIREALYEVYPEPWQQAVNLFRRDLEEYRESEISIWETIAGVYLRTCRKFALTAEEKQLQSRNRFRILTQRRRGWRQPAARFVGISPRSGGKEFGETLPSENEIS